MQLQAEISVGELIDKITILAIKLERIGDPGKRDHVAREHAALTQALPAPLRADEAIARLQRDLSAVNGELWRIEDDIRAKERAGDFGPEFIALARSVYRVNDRRAALKRRLNEATQSRIVEQKSYEPY